MRIDEFFSGAYLMPMPNRNEPQLLAESRKAAGIKQRELADHLGIAASYMSDIENGRRPVPQHLLTRLPDAIRVPLVRARIAELEKLLPLTRAA